MNNQPVRVRIAPSPTGNLHVGTARTALFNELFAKANGGSFIIRLEDTDKARSKPEFEKNIIEGLQWLGLSWNEGPDSGGDFGPYRQSERTEMYTAALQTLLDQGKATRGEGETIVLTVEPAEITFHDEVRGDVTVHTDNFGGSFIIARSLTDPLFHLAVVVDDAAMQITHVIRGEDHLHNTVRHILLQRALGYPTPIYAHLPLLLDENRAKLSKRSNETSLLVYRDLGYLPEAMCNYLALLGWNAKNDQEFFTHEELVHSFSLAGIQKSGAIFSIQKLQAMNREYIRKLTPAQLRERVAPFLPSSPDMPTEKLEAALVTEQPRVNTLTELAQAIHFFLPNWKAEYQPETLIWRKSDATVTGQLLEKLHTKLLELTDKDFEQNNLETVLLAWIDENELGRGDTLWPMRVALTGQQNSPGPFEVASVLGKAETVKRITTAQEKLKTLL